MTFINHNITNINYRISIKTLYKDMLDAGFLLVLFCLIWLIVNETNVILRVHALLYIVHTIITNKLYEINCRSQIILSVRYSFYDNHLIFLVSNLSFTWRAQSKIRMYYNAFLTLLNIGFHYFIKLSSIIVGFYTQRSRVRRTSPKLR